MHLSPLSQVQNQITQEQLPNLIWLELACFISGEITYELPCGEQRHRTVIATDS